IARAEAGSLRDSMSWVDLSTTLHDAAELYEPLAEEHGIELVLDVPEKLMIWGTRELLSQAVANLLDNAINHGLPSESERHRAIAIAAVPEILRGTKTVALSVTDRGQGIPEGQRQHVLERFVR